MKVSKKMFEISEKMKSLRAEAEVLNHNGETEKAIEKMNEYDELKKSFDAEKRIYESERILMLTIKAEVSLVHQQK